MIYRKIWIICRVCLKQQDKLYNLFEDKVHNNIWTLLRDCGGVPVRKSDSFPDKICELCLTRLWRVMDFRMDCQRSHRELLQRQMKSDLLFYEEDNSMELLKTSKIPSRADMAEEEQQIPICLNEDEENTALSGGYKDDSTVDPSDNDDVKQYCIITRNTKRETSPASDGESQSKQPIVLLLRLKNIANESLQKETANDSKPLPVRETGVKDVKIGKRRKTVTKTLHEVVKEDKNNFQLQIKTEQTTSSKLSKKNNNKFECNICEKVCKTQELLRHHMYIHKKPYECKVCHKRFSQSQSFSSHSNRHTGIKPYGCRICFQTFSDIANRNSHERQLHKQQIFKCNSCDKTFRFLTLLQKHSNTHKLKKCLICDKDFASVRMVRVHHQRKHLKLLAL